MSEPISSSAAGVAGWKLVGGATGAAAIGAGLAAVVVMCMTHPRTAREWIVGVISTVMGSITGGAFVIQHFGLQSWVYDPFGLVSLLGLVFACGLPAWAIVRWVFTFITKREGKDLGEVIQDARDALTGRKPQ